MTPHTPPTHAQERSDYLRGWNASRDGTAAEPRYSLDAFDAGYNDEQAGARKFSGLDTGK